ncbi:MAG: putative glycosyltransferase [Chloroflexi bacterium]|nr:putative glycosyltransferase [Chloroflexota bacterium]
MKILFLAPRAPLPADQGAKLRTLALIQAAAAHHEVHLLAFGNDGDNPHPLPEGEGTDLSQRALHDSVSGLCRVVRLVDAPGPRALLGRAWRLLFDSLPDVAHRLDSNAYRTALWEMLEANHYDVIQIEGLEMMPYLGSARGGGGRAAILYDAHNAEMSLQRSIFQVEFRDPRYWHRGLYSMTQWSKLGTYERVMMNETDQVIAVSEPDVAKLHGRHVDPVLIPNGVATASIPYREPSLDPGRSLLFIGPLEYRPNADAVRWLVDRVFPLIRARSPEITLRLVGKGTERVQAPGVEALGYVEDASSEFERADAVIVPMRMGGGTRFKVLEAMASGVPVVSTSIGLAGIAAEHDRHALIADSAQALAAATLRILEDRELARGLSGMARLLVQGRYDWDKITPQYLRLLTTARHAARQPRQK